MKQPKGLPIALNTDNPETPQIVNPMTGQAQRATYTDVLLFALLEKVDDFQEKLLDALEKLDDQIEPPKATTRRTSKAKPTPDGDKV